MTGPDRRGAAAKGRLGLAGAVLEVVGHSRLIRPRFSIGTVMGACCTRDSGATGSGRTIFLTGATVGEGAGAGVGAVLARTGGLAD